MKLVIAMNSASRDSIWRWPEWATARLRDAFPRLGVVEYGPPMDQPAVAGDAAVFADAEVVVAWRLDPALWREARRLRWIHCPSAAVHQLLTPELVASGIAVTNGASVHAATVAEHALALMLALARGLPRAARLQAARRWEAGDLSSTVGELNGATALIVGLGHIGRALAPRLRALGMTVLGVRRHPVIAAAGCDEMHPPEALDDLLARADYVVLALPVTAATQSVIGARQFAALRPNAVLINIGRAAAVDEAALMTALAADQLGGVGLDVFAHEPLPPDSPLWTSERVLITPHIAAASPQTWQRQVDLIAAHLRRFIAGEPLHPLVDKLRGY